MALRVALVGLGEAGFTLHLPALAEIPEATVVGACDVDAARRERARGRFGVATFERFGEMLDTARPEVVIIGTPPDTHAPYCIQAFGAGAHVICEKPFVNTLAEGEAVVSAAASARRGLAVNHEFREMPIFRAIREAVGSDPRQIVFAQVWQLMDMAPWAESGWRGQLQRRTLFEAGIHLVDFLLALFGELPATVVASMSNGGRPEGIRANAEGGASDALALVTMEFADGRLAQIVQTRLCKGERQYFEARIDLPGGSLRASFGGRARLTAGMHRGRPHARLELGAAGIAWRDVGARRTILASNPKEPVMRATRDVFERTLRAFRDGTTPPTTAAQALAALEVINACYEAASTGRRVHVSRVVSPRLEDLVTAGSFDELPGAAARRPRPAS